MTNHHQSEQAYEELLVANPRQPDLWCSLGDARLRARKQQPARAAFENALRLSPNLAAAHFGLAAACKLKGEMDEAIVHYRRGLAIFPGSLAAMLDLGIVLAERGQIDDAIEQWRQILLSQPENYQAYHNLGVALAQKQQPDEAIRCFERALQLKPDYADACFNLANVLCHQKSRHGDRRPQGIARYLQAIQIRPEYVESYLNLGTVLTEIGRPGEAILWIQQAIRLCERAVLDNPEDQLLRQQSSRSASQGPPPLVKPLQHRLAAAAYTQLGLAFCALANFKKAEAAYQKALALRPAYADAYSNLGNMFQEQGRLAEALVSYDLALIHDPQSPVTHWNRSLSSLQSGDFERGWRDYEWRWQRKQTPPRPFAEPRWDGTPFPGRTLLIHLEQGLGDMIQFIRFAAAAKERGGRILVECPHFLLPLLARCPGIDEIVPEGTIGTNGGASASPRFDLQIPVMSLPGVLGTTLESVPNTVPYVFVDDALVERWRQRLEEATQVHENSARPACPSSARDGDQKDEDNPLPEPRSPLIPRSGIHSSRLTIGIAWQGNTNHRLDRYRSIALAEFAPLAQVPGVQLVSLQKGPGSLQIQQLNPSFAIWEPGQSDQMTSEALLDTAALMKNLDLVISVDTGTAHLAGALGVPVWVPLSAIGEWRWLLHREDSPWYLTMRLFRQKKLGRWRGVFRRIVRELQALMPEGN